MYDHELQEIILAENKKFFEWARQKSEEPMEEPLKLSKYEDSVAAVESKDLSDEALKLYQSRAKLRAKTGSVDFQRLLQQQGILVKADDKLVPSGFGLILFGKSPSNSIPQARLLAQAELPNGKSSRMEFADALVLIPNQVEDWLNKILPTTIDRSRMVRQEQVELPFEMLREAVVNALIHRDYDLVGQKCQLIVNADTITIKSPGGPIPPITLEQMRTFSAPIKSRNPLLHYVFARMGMAEEMGYGLTNLKQLAERLGLPLPSYTMEGGSLVLTIYRTLDGATKNLGSILSTLTPEEQEGWKYLATRTRTTQSEYAQHFKVTSRTAQRHLSHFVKLAMIQRVGGGPATEYRKL
jgi:ATP-dependent DNA helicase RecG